MRVAICDDNNIMCSEIEKQLLGIRPECNVSIYNSGTELLSSEEKYDLIFLDIEMDEKDGIETAKELRKLKDEAIIIFLTSHTEKVFDTFKVKAFRFLNKPIDSDKFEEAVLEAEKELLNEEKICIETIDGTEWVSLNDIVYLEAYGDGTYIFTANNVLDSKKTLKNWNDKLGNCYFFQTHRSYIISLDKIKKIETNAVTLNELNAIIPVSRRRVKQLKEAVMKYMREQSHFM